MNHDEIRNPPGQCKLRFIRITPAILLFITYFIISALNKSINEACFINIAKCIHGVDYPL